MKPKLLVSFSGGKTSAYMSHLIKERWSDKYGYICDECYEELVMQWGESTYIPDFLEDTKPDVNVKAAVARFEIEFPKE